MDIDYLYKHTRKSGILKRLSRNEYKKFVNIFNRTFSSDSVTLELKKEWDRLDMELTELTISGSRIIVVHDHLEPGRSHGRGMYAFRKTKSKAWAIQAPHSTDDAYTGRIALKFFKEEDFAAGAWNNLERKQIDLAHENFSCFQAFTQAFIQNYSKGRILQIHGFDYKKRDSEVAKSAGAIISNGTTRPPAWLKAGAKLLEKNLREEILIYPYDVKELGGTTNSQSHLSEKLGFKGFIHLELSRKVRSNILKDYKSRKKLISSISGGKLR